MTTTPVVPQVIECHKCRANVAWFEGFDRDNDPVYCCSNCGDRCPVWFMDFVTRPADA